MSNYKPPGRDAPMPHVTDEEYVRWIVGHGTGEMLKRAHQPAERDGRCETCGERCPACGRKRCTACGERWPCVWYRRAERAIALGKRLREGADQ
jgi:hypothetical protein